MRIARIALAASAIAAVAAPAKAGGRSKAPAPQQQHKGTTYLSPVTKNRRIVGFKRSLTAPRGFFRKTRDALLVTFGKKAMSAALPETTLWIPGHTLGWRSLRPAMKHFLGNPANGQVAAVYVAREGRFRANKPSGRVLSDAEVRASKLVTVQFSNPRAGQARKSGEIAAAVRALRRAKGGAERLPLRVVTHSAGDTHFRAALMDHIDPRRDGIKITRVVAVGPVFAGTWTGNVGNSRLGALLGMREAASELAEGSPFLDRLEAAREGIDGKIEGDRVDIAFQGSPTPKLRRGPHVGPGDGFVQSDDVRRPGASTLVLRGLDPTPGNHLGQIMYSGTVKAAEEILAAP
ncbi:MAG TPA: hypothetical protein VFU21_25805 [Kofleriaceae bacterium]|nr:hypothetical protein [Kofleriaceae bacterium]